ncbi:hypothetical protein ACGFIG_27130 [Micromonospora sp. NPDC049048]|uniref:hypothetical protein n=1 Tax=Micromonospora sp. NPDC049048 TaxID=3364263 RepID=UPI003718A494
MTRFLPATAVLLTLASPVPAVPTPSTAATPPPSAAPATPRIAVPAGTLRAGTQIPVTLSGWPAGTVQIEVCGNAARRGALDCATSGAGHGQVPPSGTVSLPVRLAAPPVGCPCLLRARTPTGGTQAAVALPLAGVNAPPAPVSGGAAELVVADLRAADRAGVGGWFGVPGDLTVDLTLRNVGPADAVDPPFSLLFGRPGRVHTFVDAPPLGTIGAGQTREYRIRVPTDVTVIGRHELHGRIESPTRPVAFTVETARYPWGLLGLAAAPLLWALARPGRRHRPAHRAATGVARPPADRRT